MPVKIFVPKIPANEDEFTAFIKKMCNTATVRISKNKDGSSYCIILLNYTENVKCANDVIRDITGKVIGDIVLKPRIYVDQALLCKISNGNCGTKETPDDVVNTTHFGDGYYFVQLFSEKDANVVLTSMLRDLYEEYKSGIVLSLPYDAIVIGELYATFYNDEKQFYRIRVLEKHSLSKIKIAFIDYGNEEIVNYEHIVPITSKLSQISPMVHKCVITGVKIINYKREELAAREVLHRNYRAKLVKQYDDVLQSDRVVSLDYLDFTSVSYRGYLIIEDIAEEEDRHNSSDGRFPTRGISKGTTDDRNGFKEEQALVMITHFDSLDEFYVQQANKTTDDAMTLLSGSVADLLPNMNEKLQYEGPEYIYLSQFSQDGNWYRCRVIEDRFDSVGSASYCVVQYIDFGNTELKYNKRDLKPLADQFWPSTDALASISPCAKKCRFSDDMIYALSKAKMEKDYFQQNFVNAEKIVTFMYYIDRSNKVWIVDNIRLPDNEEIMALVLQQCESSERKTDVYRLSNLEYLDKIWFSLVKSIDPVVQDQLMTIEKWSKEQNIKELEPARHLLPGTMYCAKLQHAVGGANLVRCNVLGKNKHNTMIQAVDSGIYEAVPLESVFTLHESLREIAPLARQFKLVFSVVCAEEHQIEEKIVQIVGSHSVELDMVDERSIRDVIIKEKSLVQCLAQLDYIQPTAGLRVSSTVMDESSVAVNASRQDSSSKDGEYRDLPECLLPIVRDDTERNCVDFSLPSVEKMDEVPNEISVCNAKVRVMRKLFSSVETENIFDMLHAVVLNCDKLVGFVDCCKVVDELSTTLETLNGEFVSMSGLVKAKLRDFDPLIEKRTDLCQTISAQYAKLKQLLLEIPSDNLESLLIDIGKMELCVESLVQIFQLSSEKRRPPVAIVDEVVETNETNEEGVGDKEVKEAEEEVVEEKDAEVEVVETKDELTDIVATQQKVAEFRDSELYQSVLEEMDQQAALTDDVIAKYRQLMETMCRDYRLGDVLPSAHTAVIPLIDRTYELHSALKSECAHFAQLLLGRDDVVERFDLAEIVWNYCRYLRLQHATLEMIMAKSNQLETLNAYSEEILADNSTVCQQIEENHKRIIMYRSALKHSIADMEDAEEQDDREKIEEISEKIGEVRQSLHEALMASRDIIDSDVRKLMLKKPELQLKNQSIFYCTEGIPVFLWDSIFFEIPHSDLFVDFFRTRFASEVVNMKKLSLSADNYKLVLHNLTTYSSRINGHSESIVLLLPISYVFLSKSENTTVYAILPNFAGVHQLPDHFSRELVSVVDFFRSTINQILNLWHLGFTFSENDLINGLFVTSESDSEHVFLPLPLSSILNRENINHKCDSIQVYFSKLGDLLQESLSRCPEFANVKETDVQTLVNNIKNCKGVEEAEQIFEELDQFLVKNPVREINFDDTNDSSNDNASSIEQLPHDEEEEDHADSPQDKEISVTEQILEIYSDVE